jgi:dipeptidyl aminopeptidase/acylaminoacyl peptidase
MFGFVVWAVVAGAADRYEEPPAAIVEVLDAPRPPVVMFSGDDVWMLELSRPDLPSIAEIAAPRVQVAGLQLDPRTFGPAASSGYTGITVRPVGRFDRVERRSVALPDDPRVGDVTFAPDDRWVSFTHTASDGVELWVFDVATAMPKRLVGPRLNATYGAPCSWLGDGTGLLCKIVPASLGPAPERDPTPTGPRVAENRGRVAPARTYQHLIEDAHDEALFEHYLTSEIVKVDLDGALTPVLPPDWYDEVTPSPDARWLLVERLARPWSTTVPISRFPRVIEARPVEGGAATPLALLPLADDVPVTFDSVRRGRRVFGWRPDQPATLWFVEAQDGGDAGVPAETRDRLSSLAAPFTGAPVPIVDTTLRFESVAWDADGVAFVTEAWWRTRQTRTLEVSAPGAAPVVHWERSSQDRYADPGDPQYTRGPYGAWVLRRDRGDLLLTGDGWSDDGMRPFYDRYDPVTRTSERIWRSEPGGVEQVVTVMSDPRRFVTRRQSATEPPNHHLREGRRSTPLTNFQDWAPAFAEVTKEVVTYTRADGVLLSATLYLPPGYDPATDGPLPTVFWAYPSEFKHRSDAGQVTASDATFSRPSGSSHLFFLLHGYAVVDDPSMPILGEGDDEPNDTFVEQLVAGAEAAVQTFVDRGVSDPERIVVGGHSYGAFMVAHLLAHTDLFAAGIGRSGAYNRTLTPFGFQGEERTFWQAPDTYLHLSPFTHAAKIDEPLLLIHGADDSNSGTFPIQSERLYDAIKGAGGTARWVVLPAEDHGYRARESVGHVLWEMLRWADASTAAPP